MFCLTKTLFRTALIGGLAVGGLTLVVGPQRVSAGLAQIRGQLTGWFDEQLDDPVVVRQQIRELQKQYPMKIREVRRALAQIDAEINALNEDSDRAARVVTRAEGDLHTLKGLVEKANYVQQASYTEGENRPVLVSFQGRHITVDQAYGRAQSIKQAMVNFQERLSTNQRDLALLTGQRERVAGQLAELENEFRNFQAQAWHVERQAASIERNEALIEMMEEREDMIASTEAWNVQTLDQLSNRLSTIQAEHEAILQSLSDRAMDRNYEQEAMGKAILEELEGDPFEPATDDAAFERIQARNFPTLPIVVDENTPAPPVAEDEKSIASLPAGGN